MLISPYRAAVSPYTMPLSIWARTIAGFTTTPQSIAHHTLCTRGRSFSMETSATSATKEPNDSAIAIPRARPWGAGEPQSEAFATASMLSAEDSGRQGPRVLIRYLGGRRAA